MRNKHKLKFKVITMAVIASLVLVLAACESSNQEEAVSTGGTEHSEGTDHSGMNHSGSGEVPEGLKKAAHPTYAVGSNAIMEADHMPGMKGAEATIVGAYDTTVYMISYKPTHGGPEVKNHKWVIHEELQNPGETPLPTGTKVVVEADHMEGMQGATTVIDSAEQTTVYMVDYSSTTDGKEVTNHKWVTESELTPVP
ncbi:YdhK family protein [Paenibacillus sp. JCM 10914]|uniref:YdhK family protein n=1 Tax=Paenibacillus sp. JCM 10914 TaxID=1236974 RepID=UPI0003CC6B04|nr:YdhK family protein [Paenibacillus sp. JCM 10914]GAE04445.1 DUF1541 domain-containing protein [Paenibacillus sp. JCM 10914]